MSDRVSAKTEDLHVFVSTGRAYTEDLNLSLGDVLAARTETINQLGFVPEVDSINPFRELLAEATVNNRFVDTIREALIDFNAYRFDQSGDNGITSASVAYVDAALTDLGLNVDGQDRDLNTDLLLALTPEQLDNYFVLLDNGIPPLHAELLVTRTDEESVRFIDGAQLADLNRRIDTWTGSDNDETFDQMVRQRNQMIADFTGSEDTWDYDPDIVAVAIQNGLEYEQADFAVTTVSIDQVSQEIADWPGHPYSEEAQALFAEQAALIDHLAESDSALANEISLSVNRGESASDALFTAVGSIYGDQNLSTILTALDERGVDEGTFDPIGIALHSTFVESVEEFTGSDIENVDIFTAVVAQDQGETYNTIVAMMLIDQQSEDPQMVLPEGAAIPTYLDVPVGSGREAAFRLMSDREGVFREIETATENEGASGDGRMSEKDWAAVLNPEQGRQFSDEAIALATFFEGNPDEWLKFDTARDDGAALSMLSEGEYGVGGGDNVTSFADVQQYITNTDVFNSLVTAVGGENPLLVDLDNNGRFSEEEFQEALVEIEARAVAQGGEDGRYYEGLAQTVNFVLETDMLNEPDNRSLMGKIGDGVMTIGSLVPNSPTNYYRMMVEPEALLDDYWSFGEGAVNATAGLGLFVYDVSSISPTTPGFWIERWRVDGDMSEHRGMQLATALPAMGEAGLSLMPGTPQYAEQMRNVREQGTWDAHAGANLVLTVADWEGFVDDPAKWAGQFAPDVIVTALSGGGGMITRAGSTGARLANASRRLLTNISTNGLRLTTQTGLRRVSNRLAMLPTNWRHARLARNLPQDGSVYMMMPDDPFLINSARRGDVNPDGILDVVAHGNPDIMRLDMPSGEQVMTAAETANFIRNKSDFTGQPIRLLSCKTGCRPDGFAQQLADELGVPVYAANDLVVASENGVIRVAAEVAGDPLIPGRTRYVTRPEHGFRWFEPNRVPGDRSSPDVGSLDGAARTSNPDTAEAIASSDAIRERQINNAELRGSSRFDDDMGRVGVNASDVDLMFAKRKPLGFDSEAQFAEFNSELAEALRQAGLEDASIGLKGTATTFYSENPGKALGHHWDADPANPGDYDLNITSDSMVNQLDSANIKPHENYGVFKTRDINANFAALDDFQTKWGARLGRDVNFVGYPEPTARDLTEYVLVGDG